MTEKKTYKCQSCGKVVKEEDVIGVILSCSVGYSNCDSTRSRFFRFWNMCEDCEKKLVKEILPEIEQRLIKEKSN